MTEDETPEPEAKRPMTLAEAGRRGGEKVKKERGRAYYAEIGRKGGASVKARRGPAFYAEIGRKGGEARRKDAGAPTTAQATPDWDDREEKVDEDTAARRRESRENYD